VQSQEAKLHVEVVTKGLDHPWGMAFLPDGSILVTERPGRLRVIRNGVLDPTPIAGLPAIYAPGIAGLTDIVLDPNFASNRLIYLAYSKAAPDTPAGTSPAQTDATLAVMRARMGRRRDADRGRRTSSSPTRGTASRRCHPSAAARGPPRAASAGGLAIGPDGKLYVT
jgi:glucose/arabinose dehydrogenase